MALAIVAVVALLAGLGLGFFLGGRSAAVGKAVLEQKAREDAAALAKAQEESARRAGFESLAVERQATILRLTAERDAAQNDVQAAAVSARTQAARISEL